MNVEKKKKVEWEEKGAKGRRKISQCFMTDTCVLR